MLDRMKNYLQYFSPFFCTKYPNVNVVRVYVMICATILKITCDYFFFPRFFLCDIPRPCVRI